MATMTLIKTFTHSEKKKKSQMLHILILMYISRIFKKSAAPQDVGEQELPWENQFPYMQTNTSTLFIFAILNNPTHAHTRGQ